MADDTTRRRPHPLPLQDVELLERDGALLSPNNERRFVLYVLESYAGTVLYVGITSLRYPVDRVLHHRGRKFWGNRIGVVHAWYTPHTDRRAAELYERQMIYALKPRYNVVHGSHPAATTTLEDFGVQLEFNRKRWAFT